MQKIDLENFIRQDFPPPEGSLPGRSQDFVYIFLCKSNEVEIPFYVGRTGRLSERMGDYESKEFAAPTDFRVGTAIQYLQGKGYRVIVKYKPSEQSKVEEKTMICELLLGGARLLNCIPSYDFKTSKEKEVAEIVRRFCDLLITKPAA